MAVLYSGAKMQYLYLIRSKEFLKIGVANDVEGRLAQLQTGNPIQLSIVTCFGFNNAEVVEKSLHQRFELSRRIGEWFLLADSEIEMFFDLCKNLGGREFNFNGVSTTQDEVEEAEEVQESDDGANFNMEDARYRVETRRDSNNGNLRGFAWRERGGRKLVKYIGRRHPRFQEALELFGSQDEEP
jgi:hypothetical protein